MSTSQIDMLSDVEQRLSRLPAGSQPVETSEAAADAMTPTALGRLRRQVLQFIASRGEHGATADEIAAAFDAPHNRTSPRVTELASLQFVDRLDGKDGRRRLRRKTRSGLSAFVYVVSAGGHTLLGGSTHGDVHT